MRSSRVVVSDATRNSGLALIRELGRAGFDVRGADTRHLPLGLHSRYSPAYLYCGARSNVELAEGLLLVVRTVRPEVFLPVSTASTQAVSEYRTEFEALTGVNVPEYDSFLTAANNDRTLQTCTELGIPCPRLLDPQEAKVLLSGSLGQRPAERVVIKPRMDLGAAQGVQYVASPQALEGAVETHARSYGESVLQEYIPGDTSAMRVVLLLFDRGSNLLAHFTARKILQWPETGGLTAVAESTHEPELVKLLLPLFEHLSWQGLAEVELKIDSRDGLPKVIEINPRVPSYVGFALRCGALPISILVDAARNRLSGEKYPTYPAGIRFVRAGDFLKVLMGRLRTDPNKARAFAQTLSVIRPGTKLTSLDPTDPFPRLGKLFHELTARRASRAPGKVGTSAS